MDRRANDRGSLIFAIFLPGLAALASWPGEYSHYKRWLELGGDETGLRIAVLFAVLAKTVVVLLLFGGLLSVLSHRVGPALLRCVSLISTFFVLGFLQIDLELQRNTGNNLSDYAWYLLDPDTFVWAGEGFNAGPGLRRVATTVMSCLLPAAGLAWIAERWATAQATTRVPKLLVSALAPALILLLLTPLLQRAAPGPGYLTQLNERMPWAWLPSAVGSGRAHGEVQAAATAVYAGALSRSPHGAIEPVPGPSILPGSPPDILIVVVESLRHDALTQETMPRLWEWSRQGLRPEAHYATSNASHYGLFALLYGQSPLRYFETLEANAPPTLPTQLKMAGYSNHYITCADPAWRGMEQFLGAPHFAVEALRDTSLHACDRRVKQRATALLRESNRSPRFILAFFMSTHFGYHYPKDDAPFSPALPPPNVLELREDRDRPALVNRYRNSVHYVDGLIGDLLDSLPEPGETLTIVTGDHGESLFDDGTIAHSSRLSEIQTRVPLVLTGPGVEPGTTHPRPTDHTWILPSLMARLGIHGHEAGAPNHPDLLRDAGPGYAPLVHAKSRRGGRDHLALVGPERTFSMRLEPSSADALFLGKLTAEGRPSADEMTHEDAQTAIRWFNHYTETWAGPDPSQAIRAAQVAPK